MKASIIVSYKGDERTAEACLRSLYAQETDHDFEVLPVSARYNGNNFSQVKGQTLALAKATGDVILFTDIDVLVPRDWLESHLSFYPFFDMVLGYPAHSLRFLSFRNFSAKREVIQKLGINDMQHQDTDLAYRIIRHNLPVSYKVAPFIKVYEDDVPPTGAKLFYYTAGVASLMLKYRIFPDWSQFKYGLRHPLQLVAIVIGLLYPHEKLFQIKRPKRWGHP